jgi:hypothetical protein
LVRSTCRQSQAKQARFCGSLLAAIRPQTHWIPDRVRPASGPVEQSGVGVFGTLASVSEAFDPHFSMVTS